MSQSGSQPAIVRRATVADADAIAQVHVASWQATYPGIVPQHYIDSLRMEEFADRWRDRLANDATMSIFVAESEATICGFASGGPARAEMQGFPGELYAIYLNPQSQGRGIGSRLFWAVAEHLQTAGYPGLYVWVLDENPSRGFYRKLGGRELSSAEIEIGGKRLKEVSYGWEDLAAAMRQARASTQPAERTR